MAGETLKALSDMLAGLSAEDREKLLASVAAANDEKRHPVIVAAEKYERAMKLDGVITADQAMQLVQAIDTLGEIQGAMSTMQITQVLRALLVHIGSAADAPKKRS